MSKSTDEYLGGPECYWRSEEYLAQINFSDVADIVLYYISLQPDMKNICLIESHRFYRLLEKTTKQWAKTDRKIWGHDFISGWGVKQKYKYFFIDDIASAWSGGPGPLGGTMGPAERYAFFETGFLLYKNLLLLFSYPEELSEKGGTGNWPWYKRYIEKFVFPKWRREIHAKRLESVFRLAEMICAEMRK